MKPFCLENRTFHKCLSLFIFVSQCCIIIFSVTGCTRKGYVAIDCPEGDTLTHHAHLLTLIDYKNGVIEAELYNAWNDKVEPIRYLLVDSGVQEDNIPFIHGAKIIKVPINSALVFSSVHTTPLEEIGAGNIIKGIADAEYFHSHFIQNELQKGRIKNVGNSLSPSLESIIELTPDVALVSPYENSGHGILDKAGTEVIDMADYMESTPLARAEWIKFLGVLTGKRHVADSIFNKVEIDYKNIADSKSYQEHKYSVLTETPVGNIWYQPGGQSYFGALIQDAGGKTLFSDDNKTGSIQLDVETVIEKAQNAEIWIIKSSGPLSKSDLLEAIPMAKEIPAFKQNNVWYVNTSLTDFYDTLAFHPEKILEDFSKIFQPADNESTETKFYQKIMDKK